MHQIVNDTVALAGTLGLDGPQDAFMQTPSIAAQEGVVSDRLGERMRETVDEPVRRLTSTRKPAARKTAISCARVASCMSAMAASRTRGRPGRSPRRSAGCVCAAATGGRCAPPIWIAQKRE